MQKIYFNIVLFFIGLFFYFYTFKSNSHSEAELISCIMAYPMTNIIERCKKDYKYTDEDMVILERELKRYLALSAFKFESNLGSGMYSRDVDNLWHTFILFTRDYEEFCKKFFNKFIHHIPEIDFDRTPEKIAEGRLDFRAFIKNYKSAFNEEPHAIWFLDMVSE